MSLKLLIDISFLCLNTTKEAEFNEKQIYDQLEDNLNGALELTKTSGEKAHLEQKTKTGKTNENTIMENEANKKMRGLKKLASTEMIRMRNLSKDQELRAALKDLKKKRIVKAQFIGSILGMLGKAALGWGAGKLWEKITGRNAKNHRRSRPG